MNSLLSVETDAYAIAGHRANLGCGCDGLMGFVHARVCVEGFTIEHPLVFGTDVPLTFYARFGRRHRIASMYGSRFNAAGTPILGGAFRAG